ncbi:MAG: DNA-binding protein [Proteobacteria bacterium]|nr:MAG: DNA-binding protein [Pseudomonadota bacterium]
MIEYLTIKEAASLANLSEKTIRNWIKSGKVVAEFSVGLRRWRIEKKSFLGVIAFGKIK